MPDPEPSVTPDWEMVRNFNAGVDGSPAGFPSGFDAPWQSVFTTAQVHEGDFAAAVRIQEGSDGFPTWGGQINFPDALVKGDVLWHQMWVYYPPNPTFIVVSSNNWLKYWRVRNRTAADTHVGYFDLLLRRDMDGTAVPQWLFQKEDPFYDFETFGANIPLPRGQWVRQTTRCVVDNIARDDGGLGEVMFWQNGVLLANRSIRTISNATDRWIAWWLHTFWNGGAPQTQESYVDDIRLAKNGVPAWVTDLPSLP
jgi:hypothetical protein